MSLALLPLFQALGHVPPRFAGGSGRLAGKLAGAWPNASRAQLLKNHQRLSSQPLSRPHAQRALAAYFDMFASTPSLHRRSEADICQAVTAPARDAVKADLDRGPVVIAMTHSGNWDLAGAWANLELAPVLTVAEVLQPVELFDYFTHTRKRLGIDILPARRGVFRKLSQRAKGQRLIVPLLADRDITGSGVEVDFGGNRALVAAGPAALANELGAALWVNHMSANPPGDRAKYTMHLRRVELSGDVEADTQAWVDAVVPLIQSHLVDWHMLQPLFVEDLDPQRLARARERHVAQRAAEQAPAGLLRDTAYDNAQDIQAGQPQSQVDQAQNQADAHHNQVDQTRSQLDTAQDTQTGQLQSQVDQVHNQAAPEHDSTTGEAEDA